MRLSSTLHFPGVEWIEICIFEPYLYRQDPLISFSWTLDLFEIRKCFQATQVHPKFQRVQFVSRQVQECHAVWPLSPRRFMASQAVRFICCEGVKLQCSAVLCPRLERETHPPLLWEIKKLTQRSLIQTHTHAHTHTHRYTHRSSKH